MFGDFEDLETGEKHTGGELSDDNGSGMDDGSEKEEGAGEEEDPKHSTSFPLHYVNSPGLTAQFFNELY